MKNKISGPSDLYEKLLEMKAQDNIKAFPFRKSEAKKAKIEWSFVEQAAQILGFEIAKSGNGYLIMKP